MPRCIARFIFVLFVRRTPLPFRHALISHGEHCSSTLMARIDPLYYGWWDGWGLVGRLVGPIYCSVKVGHDANVIFLGICSDLLCCANLCVVQGACWSFSWHHADFQKPECVCVTCFLLAVVSPMMSGCLPSRSHMNLHLVVSQVSKGVIYCAGLLGLLSRYRQHCYGHTDNAWHPVSQDRIDSGNTTSAPPGRYPEQCSGNGSPMAGALWSVAGLPRMQ